MPNRILKESICTSESINALSWFEEAFFYRLITNCDDYGRMDARAAILKSRLFPLKDVTAKQVESVLSKLSTLGMVRVYEYDRQPYLELTAWGKHQRLRDSKEKYPAPPEDVHSPQLAATCGEPPPESQSEYESNPNRESESFMPGDIAGRDPPRQQIISLTLNDKSEYPIFADQADEWAGLYPAVDVMQQLRAMKGWLDGNPKKRKTKAGIMRFINGWLAREQDKPHLEKDTANSFDGFKAMHELLAGEDVL